MNRPRRRAGRGAHGRAPLRRFADAALAGAVALYDDAAALLAGFDGSPLGGGLRDAAD